MCQTHSARTEFDLKCDAKMIFLCFFHSIREVEADKRGAEEVRKKCRNEIFGIAESWARVIRMIDTRAQHIQKKKSEWQENQFRVRSEQRENIMGKDLLEFSERERSATQMMIDLCATHTMECQLCLILWVQHAHLSLTLWTTLLSSLARAHFATHIELACLTHFNQRFTFSASLASISRETVNSAKALSYTRHKFYGLTLAFIYSVFCIFRWSVLRY